MPSTLWIWGHASLPSLLNSELTILMYYSHTFMSNGLYYSENKHLVFKGWSSNSQVLVIIFL